MDHAFIRNRNTWVAYLLLALYGYFLNILGPITPFLHDEFHLSYTVSSLHFSAFAFGILAVGFSGHLVIERTGRHKALAIGAIGLGLAALLLVLGRAPAMTVGAAFLMGCIGSLILAVVPAALSEEHGELRAVAISEANVLSSLISVFAPIFVGLLAGFLIGWRLALIIPALLIILIGGLLFWTDRSQVTQHNPIQPSKRLPPLFWFYWICIVLAVATEFCMIYWSADYMASELALSRASAAQAVSLFLAGMIIGRLVGSRVVSVLSARSVVLVSILLGMFGFGVYWYTTNTLAGMVALAVTGLGIASLYPLLVSMAIGASAGSEAQAGSRATLASGVAILILPLVLGRLADFTGLKGAFAVVAVLLLTLLFMILIARRFTSESQAGHQLQKTSQG